MFKRRKIIYLILAFVLLFNCIAFADNLQDLKKKKKSTTHQINQKKKEIEALESQSKDVSIEIAELDKEMDRAQKELEKVE